MEEKTIVAYQGKFFSVTLQSMLGSTNYGWCLTNMPEGVVLFGIENVPTTPGIGPVNQVFYFGVTDVPENPEVVLNFKMYCLSDFSKSGEEVAVNVKLVPYNKDNGDANTFVTYSENSAVYNAQIPYGFVFNKPEVIYGYPIQDNANLKYGYPCQDNANLKYGYPCQDNANLKYGYPCQDNANLKYGYPCQDNANLKYGYPCQDNANLKYGYPCQDTPVLKYGYPCQDNANLTYGYRCQDIVNVAYGYRCQDTPVLKYGYPCGSDIRPDYGYPSCIPLKYGYPNCQ